MLSELILQISRAEQNTELYRQLLAEQKRFEPYTAFRRLDRSRCGEVFQQDLYEFMDLNGLKISNLEASSLFRFLDVNRDGKITYTDFVKQILPKEDLTLRDEATMRDSYFIQLNQPLPDEVERALFSLFSQQIKNFKQLEELKSSLKNDQDFSLREVFNSIDTRQLGYIQQNNLATFLVKILNHNEIVSFFRVADNDQDGRVTFQDFSNVICPFHPSQILKDRERAYYSTPKKYRKKLQPPPSPQTNKYYMSKQFQSKLSEPKHTASQSIKRTQILISFLSYFFLELCLYYANQIEPIKQYI